jgi:hypothetical protein
MDWSFFAQLLATLVVAGLGSWIAHRLSARRDIVNERRKLRIAYLLEAYRRLESAANRSDKTPDQARAFESAVADIQLLGTSEQVQTTIKYLRQHASGAGAQIDDVLRVLRKDLRREMGLPEEVENALVFRFSDVK